jgi:hypothetical protein
MIKYSVILFDIPLVTPIHFNAVLGEMVVSFMLIPLHQCRPRAQIIAKEFT